MFDTDESSPKSPKTIRRSRSLAKRRPTATAPNGLDPEWEALSQIGAVRVRTKKLGSFWLALDETTANELRATEEQREHPRPVLMADDVAHLEDKSEEAIRAALEVIRAFPGARILH